MKPLARATGLLWLLASTACDSTPAAPDAGAGGSSPAPAATGGTGGGGSGGNAGSGGGAGSGGTSGSGGGGGGGRLDGPPAEAGRSVDGARDAGRSDAVVPGILPPAYPPAGTATCAAGCSDLRAQYAEVVLRAQRCTVGAASPCGQKAPGSLGCNSCQVWVSDVAELAPLANRFNQMGCYGCFFGGPGGENRCHLVGCDDLRAPVCTAAGAGQGTCTNDSNQACPANVMAGTPCTRADTCLRGGAVCFCTATSATWSCFGG